MTYMKERVIIYYYYAPLRSHQLTCPPQGRVGMCAGRCDCTRRCAQSDSEALLVHDPRFHFCFGSFQSHIGLFCKGNLSHQNGHQLPESSPAWDLASDPPHQLLHLQVGGHIGQLDDGGSHHSGHILGEAPGEGKVEPNLSFSTLLLKWNKGSCAAIA